MLRCGSDMAVVDGGPIGPESQPGHGHCDLLSYELALDGKRVVVDSGVFNYECGELRHYLRSTRAHNTIVVNNADQSEIWDVFRVARRSHPVGCRLIQVPSRVEFVGAHDGFAVLARPVRHRRQISLTAEQEWVVSDVVEGSGVHSAESFIHLHPDIDVKRIGGAFELIWRDHAGAFARITPFGPADCELNVIDGKYCPAFGTVKQNIVLVIRATGALPLEFGYRIDKKRG